MSDLMFDEVPVVGTKYKFGDWKRYAVHDEKNIKGFFGEHYRFLSNFELCEVYFEGLLYPSSENCYQSSKIERDYRHHLQNCSPSQSKKEWKKYPKIDDSDKEWDDRKYDVMSIIVFDKFYRNKDLREKLIETGDKYLEETNHWYDLSWGVDYKTNRGENKLGKILMKVREYWK